MTCDNASCHIHGLGVSRVKYFLMEIPAIPACMLRYTRRSCDKYQCVKNMEWACCVSMCHTPVLQNVAVCCSVSPHVAVCCSVLQCVAVCCSVLQCVVVCRRMLQSRMRYGTMTY